MMVSLAQLWLPILVAAVACHLVGFLVWMGEPDAAFRKQLGVLVLVFLGVFMLPCAWLLNRAYWKDIH